MIKCLKTSFWINIVKIRNRIPQKIIKTQYNKLLVALIMSAKDLACCLKCQMTFTTHEELFVHSCVYIKVEKNDFEELKELDFRDQREFRIRIV